MSNELHYMQEDPMSPDLEPVHRRLLEDGDSWETEQVPSSDQLAGFLRHTATRADTSIASPDVAAGASLPRPVRRLRLLSGALPAIAALLLISLGAALFGVMAQNRHQPAVTQYPKSSCTPSQISVHDLQGVQLTGIAMVSPDEGWATTFKINTPSLSGGPSLYHYSHCQWQPVQTNPAHIDFLSIDMLSAHDGWALGYSEVGTSIILHYDGSQWQHMPPPVPLAAGETINDFEMLSDQEGWLVMYSPFIDPKMPCEETDPYEDTCAPYTVGTLYHGVNGVWKSVSLGSVNPARTVPVASDEAWIVGAQGEVLLYRDGTIVLSDPLPDWPANGGANITINMLTPTDGWIFDESPPGDTHGRTLWHFDGKYLSNESALISNPRVQTAQNVQIFSGQEGWAFLEGPYTIPGTATQPPTPDPIVISALWLHDGHWRTVKWPAVKIASIHDLVEVSPVEYWAVASYPTNAYGPTVQRSALLHFVDGSWWVYS